MSNKKVLLVDNKEGYKFLDEKYSEFVERYESIDDTESIQWSKFSAVFSHYENDATDWAVEKLRNGVVEGVFKFSGGEDNIKVFVNGEFYGLPRALFRRRFEAFLERYIRGKTIEKCAEVFLACSFDETVSPPRPEGEQGEESNSTCVAAFIRSDEKPPEWCSTAFPIQSRTEEKGSLLLVNETLRQLSGLDGPHTIVLRDTYLSDGDGLDLLLHLRLSVGDDLLSMNDYSRCPVLVRLTQSLEAWLRLDSDFSILTTVGVDLVSPDEKVAEHLPQDPDPLDPEEEHLPVLEKLSLSPTGLKGRHDLANEWGPIQLWNGLCQLSASDLSFPEWARQSFQHLMQQRYYKYLFALSALRGETQDSEDGRRILAKAKARHERWQDFLENRSEPLRLGLIEDEAEKGWIDALNGLFAEVEKDGAVEAPYDDSDFQDIRELARDVKEKSWDALLVDLRLTESDSEASSRRADQLSGVRLIKRLKKARPDLPIIAVTASNKAWTAKTLREAGSDGYWIKESPEYGVRPEYTIQNAADLASTLHEVVHRYDKAAPIWTLVRQIRQLKTNRSKLDPFIPLTTEKDPAREIKSRLTAIEKRLRRAFGFLVMEFSDHADGEFDFKRLDLAFLTVWSALNEVAALHFSDPEYRGADLKDTTREHRFRFLDPEDRSVKVYWKIENGKVYDASPSIPSSLEGVLRPTTGDGKPKWPPQSKDNPRVQWLLHRAGAPDLALRMHDNDFRTGQYDVSSDKRPPLRDLRNHLEEAHGEVQEVWRAELQDVCDMVDIWETILPV